MSRQNHGPALSVLRHIYPEPLRRDSGAYLASHDSWLACNRGRAYCPSAPFCGADPIRPVAMAIRLPNFGRSFKSVQRLPSMGKL